MKLEMCLFFWDKKINIKFNKSSWAINLYKAFWQIKMWSLPPRGLHSRQEDRLLVVLDFTSNRFKELYEVMYLK